MAQRESETVASFHCCLSVSQDTSRRYENKAGAFITGIDVNSKVNLQSVWPGVGCCFKVFLTVGDISEVHARVSERLWGQDACVGPFQRSHDLMMSGKE